MWDGPIEASGYGRDGHKKAHRVAWERVHGPIPEGHHIHHVCRNRACVNVAHLELLPASEHLRLHGARPLVLLRDVRESQGLSLRDLERASGISRGLLSRFESGLATPRRHELRLLESALRLWPDALQARTFLVYEPIEEGS